MSNMCLEKIILDHNGHNLYVNVLDNGASDCIIFCHGFDSSKDGSAARFLFDGMNANIISFDLPAHGESDDDLLVSNCLDYLKVVDLYVRERFRNCSISLFGSSFGCFLIVNFLKRNPDLIYKGVFLKSAALKMDKVFRDILIEEDMDSFMSRGYTVKNRKKRMVIPYTFYEELVSNKLCCTDFYGRDFYLFHGVNDDTAFFSDLDEFKLPNVHIMKFDSNHSFGSSDFSIIIDKITDALK